MPIKDAEGNLTGDVLSTDEGIRPDVSLEKVASLQPAPRRLLRAGARHVSAAAGRDVEPLDVDEPQQALDVEALRQDLVELMEVAR